MEAATQRIAQLQGHLEQAKLATGQQDFTAAVAAQEQAVTLARTFGDERQALVQLSVLLYNLAGYCQQIGRFDDAVQALEEVVALDERTDHPDLESDRQTSPGRNLALRTPEQWLNLSNSCNLFPTSLKTSTPNSASSWKQWPANSQTWSPTSLPHSRRTLGGNEIQHLADQTRDAAIQSLQNDGNLYDLAAQMDSVANDAAAGEEPGSPWAEVATFVRATAALLRSEPIPPFRRPTPGTWLPCNRPHPPGRPHSEPKVISSAQPHRRSRCLIRKSR